MASLNPLIRPSSPLAADAWRPPTPYERFADFMTRLIAVPKERLKPVASLKDVKAFQGAIFPQDRTHLGIVVNDKCRGSGSASLALSSLTIPDR